MIRWTGLAPSEFEFPFPGGLTSTFLSGVLRRGEDKTDFGGPASRHGSLNFLFQVALYLPPWAQVYYVGLNAVRITLFAGVFFLLYYSQAWR